MKKTTLLLASIFCFFIIKAQIPTGYYDSADGLTENALKTELHNIIDDHTVKTYGDARYILDDSDVDPNTSGNIILVYSGNSVSSNWDAGATWNREHVWSKSHGFPDDTDVPYSDLHNLKPSHPTVNTDRSDKDFDEGGDAHNVATSCFFTSNTWEPRDAVKGDIARIMFYMMIRYEGDVNGEPDLELVDELTSYPNPEFGIFSTLLQWHYNDPVDEFERNRNNVIYSHQQNRNPFIDHPEFVSKIWGGGYTNPAPTISEVYNSPDIPSDAEEVHISATITDDGSVAQAEIRWGLISGALLDTISMTNTSGDLYSTTEAIPSHSDGMTVYFEVAATDDSSGTGVSTEYTYTIDNNPPAIILDEDFSSCPVSGWTTYSVSGSEDWTCSDYGQMEVNAYGGSAASDDWFISPAINLDLYENEFLTFKSWTKYSDTYYPPVELKYSTDYAGSGDPNSATWSDLSATWAAENSETWTSSGEIDLSAISGTNVYIAFRYTSSGTTSGQCAIWEIDDIYLSEKINALPEISEPTHAPVNPTESQDITVESTITDPDGTVASATIQWGTTSGTYSNTVTMNNTGDTFSGTIPAQTGGTVIYYMVEATDDAGEIRRSAEKVVTVNTNGNSLPVISDIYLTPEMPGSSDDVFVSATITDSDGSVSFAQLRWGIATGEYPYTMDMTLNGSEFSGFIPSRGEDTHIYFLIEAFDNDGGLGQSTENDYMVNNAPVIANVSVSPEKPTQNDDILISAAITDANSTVTATLKWKTDAADSYTDLSMILSGGTYEATIPQQAAGESILFSIVALDSYGKETSYTSGFGIDNANAITDVMDHAVRIYPNPASDLINISIQEYTGAFEVYIYSLDGKCLLKNSLTGSGDHQLPLNGIHEGIYILKIKQNKQYYTQKLIVQ